MSKIVNYFVDILENLKCFNSSNGQQNVERM